MRSKFLKILKKLNFFACEKFTERLAALFFSKKFLKKGLGQSPKVSPPRS